MTIDAEHDAWNAGDSYDAYMGRWSRKMAARFLDWLGQAAISLNPSASDFAEGKRFPFCTADGLTELVTDAGLQSIGCSAIEVPTVFENFEDYWRPFTLGAGPAPGYCVSLADDARQRLRKRLDDDLPRQEDGSIRLNARAWAIRALSV